MFFDGNNWRVLPYLLSADLLQILPIYAVLWILTDFNADPDPVSQTNADQCGSGSRSGSWSEFSAAKVSFLHKKYRYFM
jgi:hypothetical protein